MLVIKVNYGSEVEKYSIDVAGTGTVHSTCKFINWNLGKLVQSLGCHVPPGDMRVRMNY